MHADNRTDRRDWLFPYSTADVLKGALAKLAWHESRLAFWTGKQADTMGTIKSVGITIDDSVADLYSNSGRMPSATVRNDLLKDLMECNNKISEHKAKVADYNGWCQVLGSQAGDVILRLTQDDWLFFFGKTEAKQ